MRGKLEPFEPAAQKLYQLSPAIIHKQKHEGKKRVLIAKQTLKKSCTRKNWPCHRLAESSTDRVTNLNAKTDLGAQDKNCSRCTQRTEHILVTKTEGGPGSARRTGGGKPNRGTSAKGE
jgi:hypothetical protein